MEASSASLSLVGSVVADRYRLTKLLGEGGMGAVFLAEHMMMRKRVALKLLHHDLSEDEEILGRFRREAQAAARVDHPNVAAATDFGQASDGSFFLVLEYIEGKSLRHAMEDGPFAPERALHVARQITLGLEKAHEAGIVHRDLKPDNIMLVTKDGDPDFVKVLDFGIAKLEASSKDGKQIVTRYGTILGTPEYMSPEQAAGDPAGPPADLYSLGVMLYEMLTGKIPFDAAERTAILSMHIVAPVPRMRERVPNVFVPEPIEALVMRLLAKVAADRPGDAATVRAEIEAAAAASNLTLPHLASGRFVDRTSDPTPPAPPAPPSGWKNTDALAKTEYGLASESDVSSLAQQAKTMHAAPRKSLIPGVKLGPLDELPRPLAYAVLGAPFFIVAFVAVVIVSLASHDGKPTAAAREAGVEAPPPRPTHATAVQITNARAAGAGALETLAKEYPDDAAVQAELARALAAAGRHADMLAVVKKLDPAAVDDEIEKGVVAAALNTETVEEAYALLEGALGARGVDGLITLATMKPPRSRAVKALAKADVRRRASPAAAIYLELKAAGRDCARVRDLLRRAHESGDARCLPLLRPLREKTGCGLFRAKDCWSCLRKDDELDDAIRAVESRAAK
ncbi:MAG: serine/threonine protein kinase [Labilithrix sp.]|nr:serine/threonine protein kinase [Labilithrix sp.]MCW5817991.1 serine/threonine protein kinase [Labilithrix sp.]